MSWFEEMDRMEYRMQVKGIRKVRTPAGQREFHQPIGTPIVAHPDLPKGPNTHLAPSVLKGRVGALAKARSDAGNPKVDKRTTGGQTKSNFIHPVTGHVMGKTETGDTFEQLFQAKMKAQLERDFGCCLKLITGAGEGTNRTTALDFSVGNKGGEVKTLSSHALNQKTAIKKDEKARKIAAVTAMKKEPLLIVQVVDQEAGKVRVYGHLEFGSKTVKSMMMIGEYDFGAKDFEKAQRAAGHWDKKEKRAKDQAEKGVMTKSGEPKVGDAYDPPDEEGGVLEPGDTVIQLGDDGVPRIYTLPDPEGDKNKATEKKQLWEKLAGAYGAEAADAYFELKEGGGE